MNRATYQCAMGKPKECGGLEGARTPEGKNPQGGGEASLPNERITVDIQNVVNRNILSVGKHNFASAHIYF